MTQTRFSSQDIFNENSSDVLKGGDLMKITKCCSQSSHPSIFLAFLHLFLEDAKAILGQLRGAINLTVWKVCWDPLVSSDALLLKRGHTCSLRAPWEMLSLLEPQSFLTVTHPYLLWVQPSRPLCLFHYYFFFWGGGVPTQIAKLLYISVWSWNQTFNFGQRFTSWRSTTSNHSVCVIKPQALFHTNVLTWLDLAQSAHPPSAVGHLICIFITSGLPAWRCVLNQWCTRL